MSTLLPGCSDFRSGEESILKAEYIVQSISSVHDDTNYYEEQGVRYICGWNHGRDQNRNHETCGAAGARS